MCKWRIIISMVMYTELTREYFPFVGWVSLLIFNVNVFLKIGLLWLYINNNVFSITC